MWSDTRRTCQFVCLSATCHTARPKKTFESISQRSPNRSKSSCRSIAKRGGRAASHSLISPIVPWPKRRSVDSTLKTSKDGGWRSARRVPARTGRQARDPQARGRVGRVARRLSWTAAGAGRSLRTIAAARSGAAANRTKARPEGKGRTWTEGTNSRTDEWPVLRLGGRTGYRVARVRQLRHSPVRRVSRDSTGRGRPGRRSRPG